jgi:hypothetical protein
MPYVREVLKVPDLIVFMEAVGKTDDLKKLPKQQQDMIKKAEDLKKKLEGTKDELY